MTVNVPLAAPVTVGVNTTLKLHVALLARVDEQVVDDTENGPVVLYEIPVRVVGRLFFKPKVLGLLVEPTFVFGKGTLDGVRTACAMPAPENNAVCGLPGALSKTFRVADSLPMIVGVNVTNTVHSCPAANVEVQLFEVILKSELPVKVILLISRMA